MSAQLDLFTGASTEERVEDAKAYANANPSWRGGIVAKLVHYRATDLSDQEIERCLKGCVCGALLARVAQGLRDGGLLEHSEVVTIANATACDLTAT